jgi:hypothetical protein
MMIEQRHVEEFPTSGVEYLGHERKDKYGKKKKTDVGGTSCCRENICEPFGIPLNTNTSHQFTILYLWRHSIKSC